MSTITLPNRRVGSDLTVRLKLKDGGLAIDWSTLSRIKAFLYSDAQRAMAGRCDVSVDGDDPTILVCRYASTKMQYLGVNRIIVQCSYLGETKTYDKPALNFVRWTSDQEGEELTIDDPDIDVEIDVEDVTSSILQNILDACIQATEEAREVVDVGRGPRGYSAYEVAVQDGFEGTEEEWLESLQGETGPQGPQGEQGETGPAGVTDVEVDVSPSSGTPAGTGSVYDGTLSLHFTGLKGQSAYEVAVENGFEGTEEEWLASLVGPQGQQGVKGDTGAKGDKGDTGETGPQGLQGNTGASQDYPFELVNNETTDDATKAHSAAGAKRLKDEISQLEAKVDGYNDVVYTEQTLNADHYYGTNSEPMPYASGYGNSAGVYCKMLEVAEGEQYKITGMGGNKYARLWVLADSSRMKVRESETSVNARTTPVELTIASGEKYLYVNLSSYDSQTDKFEKVTYEQLPGLVEKVSQLETDVATLQGDAADIDNIKYRKPKLYTDTANPNYEEYVQEAYIVDLPAGNVVLKCYNAIVWFYTKSSGVYANASLSGVKNGELVPVKVTTTNDSTNYPVGKVVGYVVFSDVSGFSSNPVTSEESVIVRTVAENLAYSPIIAASLDGGVQPESETIEVSLPSTIYAVVGDTLQIYYRSVFRCVDYTKYNVDVNCNIGSQFPRYYELTPVVGNIGTRTITFSIRDNDNNILGTKSANLVVVAAGQSPASELNVLCVGASATQNGEWASELKRRLVGSGGTPVADGLSNIVFVGRKSVTSGGKQVNLEATGGYQFTSYTNASTTRYRFNVTAENEPTINIGDVYSNNGNNYEIVEINITEGQGGYFSCTGEGTPQASGTLTKVTGTGSGTITYSSYSLSGNPFAYGGVIDMQQYADEYCNPQNAEHGRIDIVYTELFGNGTSAYMDDFDTRLSQMQAFITQIRTTFPTCKFCIGLFWNPDLNGGMGVNYGASGSWHNPYGIKYSNMGLCNALQKYITDNNLSDYVFIVNWLNEFDEENDFLQTTKKVNPRSDVTEIFGVNGVHPSVVGYNQMADTAWRLFVAKFCQS